MLPTEGSFWRQSCCWGPQKDKERSWQFRGVDNCVCSAHICFTALCADAECVKMGAAFSLVRIHRSILSSLVFLIRFALLQTKSISVNKDINSRFPPLPSHTLYGEPPWHWLVLQNPFPSLWRPTLHSNNLRWIIWVPVKYSGKALPSLVPKEGSTHHFLIILYSAWDFCTWAIDRHSFKSCRQF